jgi:hypothetical protein
VKNLWLRFRYGAGCCDIFSLDCYLARKIIRPLKEFRKRLEKNGGGVPMEFKDMKEWLGTIDKMIFALDITIQDEDMEIRDKDVYKRQQEGLELFGKHFMSLWI